MVCIPLEERKVEPQFGILNRKLVYRGFAFLCNIGYDKYSYIRLSEKGSVSIDKGIFTETVEEY